MLFVQSFMHILCILVSSVFAFPVLFIVLHLFVPHSAFRVVGFGDQLCDTYRPMLKHGIVPIEERLPSYHVRIWWVRRERRWFRHVQAALIVGSSLTFVRASAVAKYNAFAHPS